MEDRSRRKLFQKRKQNFRKAGARELAEQDGKPAAWGQFFFLLSCPYHDSKPRDFMNSNHRCRATNTQLDQKGVGDQQTPRSSRNDIGTRPQGEVCLRIQSEIELRASGAKVSSMPPYSVGEPVGACWKRWFRPGSSLV